MNQIAKLLSVFLPNKREVLYAYAKTQIGQSKCKRAGAVFGCADSVNTIFKECFGNEIGGDVSTARLYNSLESSLRFTKVISPTQALRGDIIISPTGLGNGSIPNGHVGILGDNGEVMSNNSETGLWDIHLNTSIWISKYCVQGGYPLYFYRVII